jgi:hypothetical protein
VSRRRAIPATFHNIHAGRNLRQLNDPATVGWKGSLNIEIKQACARFCIKLQAIKSREKKEPLGVTNNIHKEKIKEQTEVLNHSKLVTATLCSF